MTIEDIKFLAEENDYRWFEEFLIPNIIARQPELKKEILDWMPHVRQYLED